MFAALKGSQFDFYFFGSAIELLRTNASNSAFLLAVELYKGEFNYAHADDLKRTSFYYCGNNRTQPVIIH